MKAECKDLHECKYRHLCHIIKGKCHQGKFEHYSCPLMLCKHITTEHTATKCKINAVCTTVITPLPHTWPLCHLLIALYRRWFARGPNTVVDLGLLVEYCAPRAHNFDLKWACLQQCRMLHMQCMWGVIHEIGCSFARYRYETCVKPGVCTYLGGLTPYQFEAATC